MTEDFDIHEERLSKGEKEFENALRPLRFDDFNGQPKVVENLEIFVEAAKYRGEISTIPYYMVLQDSARLLLAIS